MIYVSAPIGFLPSIVGLHPILVTPRYQLSLTRTLDIYTPFGGSSLSCGTERLTVGMPIVLPNALPCTTLPFIKKGYPSSSFAFLICPAAISSRIYVLLISLSPSFILSTTISSYPSSPAIAESSRWSPALLCPKRKSSPTMIHLTLRLLTIHLTNASASIVITCGTNGHSIR